MSKKQRLMKLREKQAANAAKKALRMVHKQKSKSRGVEGITLSSRQKVPNAGNYGDTLRFEENIEFLAVTLVRDDIARLNHKKNLPYTRQYTSRTSRKLVRDWIRDNPVRMAELVR